MEQLPVISGLSNLKQAWQQRSRLAWVKVNNMTISNSEVGSAIKTMYIPWALWLSRSLKHYWEQNLRLLLCQRKKAGALPCAGHEQSVISLRSPDTVNIMTFGWQHGSRLVKPYLPAFAQQTYRQVRLFRLSILVSRYFRNVAQHFPTFLCHAIFQ